LEHRDAGHDKRVNGDTVNRSKTDDGLTTYPCVFVWAKKAGIHVTIAVGIGRLAVVYQT
jgi:hypothetical protein